MKKSIYSIASILALSGMIFTACEDKGFSVDNSYNRLFRTPEIKTDTIGPTYVCLSWVKVPKADYYQVEYSQDSLTFENPFIVSQNGESEILENLLRVEDLMGSTRYSVRIKAFSNAGIPSSEYAETTFKTNSEQLLNEVKDITGKSATISWKAGADVSHLVLNGGDFSDQVVTLSDSEKEAGEYGMTGLTASTKYSVVIYKDELKRGSRSFSTTENYPDGYTVVNVQAGDSIHNILKEQTGKVLLALSPDTEFVYDASTTTLSIPSNISSVYFWGATGGSKRAEFRPKGLVVSAGTNLDILKFYNLDIKNSGISGDYVINQNATATVDSLVFENCTVSDTRGIVRLQTSGNASVFNDVIIKNCVISNIGSYGIFNSKDMTSATIGKISLLESTISKVAAGAMINVHQSGLEIDIDKCTFYRVIQKAKSIIDVNKLEDIFSTITNSVFARIYDYDETSTVKACSLKDKITADNVYTTTDLPFASGYGMGMVVDKTAEELFVDAENGDFHVMNGAIPESCGDPRWTE